MAFYHLTMVEKKESEDLLNCSPIIEAHTQTFERLYDFALAQQHPWKLDPSCELFATIDQIIRPVFLSWKEKYFLIKDSIRKRKSGWYVGGCYGYHARLKSEDDRIVYEEYQEDGVLNYPLKIKTTDHDIASEFRALGDYAPHHWRDRFTFLVQFVEGHRRKEIRFKIEDFAVIQDRKAIDNIYIEGQEELRLPAPGQVWALNYPRVSRSFIIAARQEVAEGFLRDRRLV